MVLCDQLDLLGVTLDKISDAVSREDADALVAHGRFLAEKFGSASSAWLDLDAPEAPALDTAGRSAEDAPYTPVTAHPSAALDALAAVAAGRARRGAVRDEGARLAAAVAESVPRAAADWLARRSARAGATYGAFFEAASSARPLAVGAHRPARASSWRHGSPHAAAYAAALAEVMSAACVLGEPHDRGVGRAARPSAAAAQLARRRRRPAPVARRADLLRLASAAARRTIRAPSRPPRTPAGTPAATPSRRRRPAQTARGAARRARRAGRARRGQDARCASQTQLLRVERLRDRGRPDARRR